MVSGAAKKGRRGAAGFPRSDHGVDFAVAGTVMVAGEAGADISASRNSQTLPRSDLIEGCTESTRVENRKNPIGLMKTKASDNALTGGALFFLMKQRRVMN
jgi:hypothetical protein